MKRILIPIAAIAIAVLGGVWWASAGGDWKVDLEAAVGQADRVVVARFSEMNPKEKEPGGLDITDRATVRDLLDAIQIDEANSGPPCKCTGQTAIEFYRGDKLLAALALAHGDRLKWPDGRPELDARLTILSQEKLPRWLSQNGFNASTSP